MNAAALLLRWSKPECSYGNCKTWRYGIRRDSPGTFIRHFQHLMEAEVLEADRFMQEYVVAVPAILQSGRKEGALAMEKAEHSIGEMKEFYGNFLVVVKALTYLMTLGKEGIPEQARTQSSERGTI